MSFGENLKRLRRDKGLTQRDLEKLTEIKFGHVSKLESNQGDPKLSTVYKLLEALECSADTLLDTKKGLTGDVQLQIERIMALPKERRINIIDVIDHFCEGVGLREQWDDKKGKWLFYIDKPENAIDTLKEE